MKHLLNRILLVLTVIAIVLMTACISVQVEKENDNVPYSPTEASATRQAALATIEAVVTAHVAEHPLPTPISTAAPNP